MQSITASYVKGSYILAMVCNDDERSTSTFGVAITIQPWWNKTNNTSIYFNDILLIYNQYNNTSTEYNMKHTCYNAIW